MGDSNVRLLNPWVLNFQKLGLELKCPLCLNFLNRPMLLPCSHIFCNCCIPCSTQFGAVCPVCKARYADGDLRPVPFMENMATIYKCLDATFCATLFQPTPADDGRVLGQSPVSINIKFDDKIRKESLENAQGEDLRSEQSKQIHSPFVNDGVDKNGRVGKHSMPMDARGQDIEMTGKKGTKFNGAMNSHSQSSRSHIRTGGNEECGTVEIEMNRMEQSSPDSRPSLDDAKGSDNYMSNQCSEHSSENWLVKRPRENDGNSIGQLRNESSASENDSHLRDVKRAKKLNYGPGELGVSSAEDILAISQSRILMTNSDNSICAFCQSSKISEVSGPMLHYSSGNLVVGDEATHPDVIHVHRACIDWAPQVYYVDDTVKNLKAEVARGAKLKCSRCGLKGAALGCYVKSCRRSYHVTCAMEISKCRWDHEDFLMLCPAHSSVRFPSEKLKSRKHISKDHDHALSTQICLPSKNWVASPNGEKEWVLCGSALSTEEKILLVKFGKITGATVSKFWNPNVTHMIAATDEKGACTRTLKVLMAILNGRWILKFDWIKACMDAMHYVDEEPYEVSLDNYGCCDGPKRGRLRALNNAPKLFNGLNFYFAGDFVLSYKEDIKDLVRAAGGTVLQSREEVAQSRNEQESSKTLVVYNIDPPEGCKLGEEVSILWQRLSEAEDIANKTGSQVIGHTWLLESIAGCKLQSIIS